MNKVKNIAGGAFVVAMVIVLTGCTGDTQQAEIEALDQILEDTAVGVPERPADVNGVIASVEGNVIIIKDEVGREALSEEDQAAKKEERQNMTQEERQALRAQELETVATEDVELTIPVGTMLYKGSGSSDGETIRAEFTDMQKGSYVSIWKEGEQIKAVKLKGTN